MYTCVEPMVRNTFSPPRRCEHLGRNIVVGATCCEPCVLKRCRPRTVNYMAFETLPLNKCLEHCVCVYMNANRNAYTYIYIYIYMNPYLCFICLYIYTYIFKFDICTRIYNTAIYRKRCGFIYKSYIFK
jgi:hypothetical protein